MGVGALALAAMGATVISLVRGPSGPPASPSPDGDLPPLVELSGRLQSINRSVGAVTLGGPQGPVRLAVNEATTVFCHGRLGALTELAVGQPVRAAYEARGKQLVAVWIELVP